MDESNKADVVDLRGLACPEPVLRTKKLVDDPQFESVRALVDDEINLKNLERLAGSLNLKFSFEAKGESFLVTISRLNASSHSQAQAKGAKGSEKRTHHHRQPAAIQKDALALSEGKKTSDVSTVIFLNKDVFGEGDRDFSQNLLNVFLQSVLQSGHKPKAILMANSGVKLLAEDSPFGQVLEDFQNQGTEVLACGLCVEFYGLQKSVAKNQITNMLAICQYLFESDRVISP
jgi:selenium metabolism protein YedF